jgi:serine/threonine protein kinase
LVSDGISPDTGAFRVGFSAGRHVAGYRLEGEIGRGTAALVYRARDERVGRLVALKILAPELASDETFQQRFIQELRAATAVRNPHLLPVFEAGQADGMLYLATRYVPGGDARSLAHRAGPLPAGRVAAIVWQAASALDALHAAGLVHRDVKPTNLLVDVTPERRRDWVYLSDFALRTGPVKADGPTRPSVNTLACMSPELIEGKPADGRADEYALAAAVFELLTGWPPFRPDDPDALRHAQLTEPPPRLTSRRPGLPAAADDVMTTALAKAPEQRYASCREFAAALAGSLGLRPPPPALVRSAGPVGEPPPQRLYLTRSGVSPAPAELSPAELSPAELSVAGLSPAELSVAEPAMADAMPAAPGSTSETASVAGPGEQGAAAPSGESSGRSGEPWLVDRRRGRSRLPLMAIALAVVAVLAAASVAVVVSGVLRKPAPKPPAKLPAFAIAARSALPPVSGAVWVKYQGTADAQAQVYGEVKDAARGYVARLYAQPFPYTARPAPVASVVLHPKGRHAPYAFQVTPELATRYHVSVFPSRKAADSLASSPAATIYVAPSVSRSSAQPCHRPTCHESLTLNVFVPPAAIATELTKPWYSYFGLSLSKSPAKPPAPSALLLGEGGPHVSAPHAVSSDEFVVSVTFSFGVGKKGGYTWLWDACVPGSVAANGLGLPGSHGCGAKSIPVAHSYLG